MDVRTEGRRLRPPDPDLALAWAAGFYDGEGSTSWSEDRGGRRSLAVAIGQVERALLERFSQAVRGKGRISRPYDKGNQPISFFRAYGSEAHECLKLIWPYLSRPKQDQALRALIAYGFRPVSNRAGMDACARGHKYAGGGTYFATDGSRECARCRKERRKGPLVRERPIAIERGIGWRQYHPAPLRVPPQCRTAQEAVVWTSGLGIQASDYAPLMET